MTQSAENNGQLHVFVSAGEPSGDRLLADLLLQLQPCYRHIQVTGLGGPLAEKAGLVSLLPLNKMAVNGISDVLKQLPYLLWALGRMKRLLIKGPRPDLVILVDYPGMNLKLLKTCRKLRLPVHYLAPPQLWTRADSLRREKRYRKLFGGVSVQTLFAFEADPWRRLGADVVIGHPFATANSQGKENMANELKKNIELKTSDDNESRTLLLCPGSRWPIIERNLTHWLKALANIHQVILSLPLSTVAENTVALKPKLEGIFLDNKGYRPVQILVPNGYKKAVAKVIQEQGWKPQSSNHIMKLDLTVTVTEDKPAALAQAGLAICYPGTMTLELALAEIQTIVPCILDRLTFVIGKRWVKSRWLALPNTLVGASLFPEWAGRPKDFNADILVKLWQELQATKPQNQALKQRLLTALGPPFGAQVALKACQKLLVTT